MTYRRFIYKKLKIFLKKFSIYFVKFEKNDGLKIMGFLVIFASILDPFDTIGIGDKWGVGVAGVTVGPLALLLLDWTLKLYVPGEFASRVFFSPFA